MPFTTTKKDLEMIILREVSHREKDEYHIIYRQNLKIDTNELIYKTENGNRLRKQS